MARQRHIEWVLAGAVTALCLQWVIGANAPAAKIAAPVAGIASAGATGGGGEPAGVAQVRAVYRSPVDLRFSPSGAVVAVSDRSAGEVVLIDAVGGKVAKSIAMGGKTGALAWSADGSRVFVAEYEKGTVAEIIVAEGKIARHFEVGAYPNGVAIARKKNLLLATSTGLHDLVAIDLAGGKEKARVHLVREPYYIAISADESAALVSNLLPDGAASDPGMTACVSIVSLADFSKTDIKLPPNSGAVRQVAISPDGHWGYALHTVGRTTLPATQLDRGWVNTNALSVIDLQKKKHYASVLLDSLVEGAADPWGIALSKDGGTAWITLAGTHQLARIDIAGLHRGLEGQPISPAGAKKMVSATIWEQIKADPAKRADLVNDLSALYVGGLITRIALPGKGPRGIDMAPDGARLAVGQYFSGDVLMLNSADSKITGAIPVGAQPAMDETRRGEIAFHDATHSFQHWLSCGTCHPNDGRVDGMNWDLPNDGLGNPKNNKSLLGADMTEPMTWLGIREDYLESTAAGFRFLSVVPSAEDVKATAAFIRSIKAEKSPHLLANGQLSPRAVRGKAIFEDAKVACALCHMGEWFTSQKRYNVGTHGALDHEGEDAFDTPSLNELWRTAPYLHDGRAATIKEVITTSNPHDKHGHTSKLSPEQIEDLAEYLLSL